MSDDSAVRRIGDAIECLEDIPKEAAWVALSAGPDGDVSVSGNTTGLARLAKILLRCALDSAEAREYRSAGGATKDLQELLRGRGHTGVSLESINLLQNPPDTTGVRARLRDRAMLWGCGLIVVIVGTLAAVGFAVVMGFIQMK